MEDRVDLTAAPECQHRLLGDHLKVPGDHREGWFGKGDEDTFAFGAVDGDEPASVCTANPGWEIRLVANQVDGEAARQDVALPPAVEASAEGSHGGQEIEAANLR